jgi:hypothetical protein
MKITGKIVGANIDFKTGKPTIIFEINERNDFGIMVDDLKDKDKLSIEVKPYRERRSLNANAYAWLLIGQIADAVRAYRDDWANRESYFAAARDFFEKHLSMEVIEKQLAGILADVSR